MLILAALLFVFSNTFSGQVELDNSNGRNSVSMNQDSESRVEAFSPSACDAEVDDKTSDDKNESDLSGSALLESLVAGFSEEIVALAWDHFDRTANLHNGTLTDKQVRMLVELVQKKELDKSEDSSSSDKVKKEVDWFPISE